jgi:hypothetical protein
MTTTKTTIDTFISQFGNTPNGVTPVQYGAGTSYSDNSNSPEGRVSGNNIHSTGELEGSNYVRTLFISVENQKGDEINGGVNLLAYTPAVKYQSNANGITDPRLVLKLDFQGAQFLTLSSDGQTLTPLRRGNGSTPTPTRRSTSTSSFNGGTSGGGY